MRDPSSLIPHPSSFIPHPPSATATADRRSRNGLASTAAPTCAGLRRTSWIRGASSKASTGCRRNLGGQPGEFSKTGSVQGSTVEDRGHRCMEPGWLTRMQPGRRVAGPAAGVRKQTFHFRSPRPDGDQALARGQRRADRGQQAFFVGRGRRQPPYATVGLEPMGKFPADLDGRLVPIHVHYAQQRMTAARLAFTPASLNHNPSGQGGEAAKAVHSEGGKLIGVRLGQHDRVGAGKLSPSPRCSL